MGAKGQGLGGLAPPPIRRSGRSAFPSLTESRHFFPGCVLALLCVCSCFCALCSCFCPLLGYSFMPDNVGCSPSANTDLNEEKGCATTRAARHPRSALYAAMEAGNSVMS